MGNTLAGSAIVSWCHILRRVHSASSDYGRDRGHHGKILAHATSLVEAGKLKPFLSNCRFSVADIGAAYDFVERGSLGKVVVGL